MIRGLRLDDDARFQLGLALVTLVAIAVRGWGLASQPLLADDLMSGISAVSFVERGQVGPTMWHHPHLRDLAVYLSTSALGTTKLGLVLPSLVLGVLSVPALALLGRRVAGPAAGIVAAALLSVEALHVGMSREAVQEVYTAGFGIAATLLVLAFDRTRRPSALLAAGFAFGLGAAAKWSVVGVAAVAVGWVGWRELRRGGPRREVAARAALVVAALVVLPATVYLLTWTPWFLAGRDLLDWLGLHHAMALEAATHGGFSDAELLLARPAATWFVLPTGYAGFAAGPGGPVPYVFVTNPAIWLLVLPSAAAVAWSAWRERRAEQALVVAAFAATYLPFVAVARRIWLHSALAAEPFALVLVAVAVTRAAARVTRPRLALAAFLAVVTVIAVPLDLLATGHGWGSPELRGIAERFRPPPELEGAAGAR